MKSNSQGASALKFENTHLDPVRHNGQTWLPGPQIAAALGYTNTAMECGIRGPIAEKFTSENTAKVKLSPEIRAVSGLKKARIFSLPGAILLASSIHSDTAKRFVLWLEDILDGETANASPQSASAPITTSGHKKSLLDVKDMLSEARHVADFVQGITLLAHGKGINLDPSQTTGLFYVMQDMMDRIKKSEELLAGVNVFPVEGETHE